MGMEGGVLAHKGVRVYGPRKTIEFHAHGNDPHIDWVALAAATAVQEGFDCHRERDTDLTIGKTVQRTSGPKKWKEYLKWRVEVVDTHKPDIDPHYFDGYEDVIFLYTTKVKNPDSISEVKEYIRRRLP